MAIKPLYTVVLFISSFLFNLFFSTQNNILGTIAISGILGEETYEYHL